MSTIDRAILSGALLEYRVAGDETREQVRPLYYAPEFEEWVEDEERLEARTHYQHGLSLAEHIEIRLADLVCENPLHRHGIFSVDPTYQSVWKVSAEGVRLFGWFCKPDIFVLVTGALKTDLKQNADLHQDHVTRVANFRKRHGLDDAVIKGDVPEVLTQKPVE